MDEKDWIDLDDFDAEKHHGRMFVAAYITGRRCRYVVLSVLNGRWFDPSYSQAMMSPDYVYPIEEVPI